MKISVISETLMDFIEDFYTIESLDDFITPHDFIQEKYYSLFDVNVFNESHVIRPDSSYFDVPMDIYKIYLSESRN